MSLNRDIWAMALLGRTAESTSGSISSAAEMIAAIRAAILKPQGFCSHLETAFFHSTPILQRKHQSNSRARNKRFGRKKAKQDIRRNVNAFAHHLFGIWSDGFDYSGKHTWWFQKKNSRVSKRNRNGRHIPQRCFDFSGRSKCRLDEEEEEEDDRSSTELSDSESNQESHRQALGLRISGPIHLEDVKTAYRACALKWHPDRHHASTKNAAEDKFKLCTVAYQSLCEKLAMN